MKPTTKITPATPPTALRAFVQCRARLIVLICACAWLGFSGLARAQDARADHAAAPPGGPKSTRPERVDEILEGVLPAGEPPSRARASTATSPSTAAASLSLIESFDAIPYTGWVPPDPIIAAGPASLVAMVNQQIAIYDKKGAKFFQQTLAGATGFWRAQKASGSVGDPWVIYDPNHGRFIAIAADFGGKIGVVYLAISKSATPTGSADWYKYRLDLTGSHVVTGGPTYPDYPKLGVDGDAIYITANHFGIEGGGYSHAQIVAIQKAPLVSGGAVNFLYSENILRPYVSIHPAVVHGPAAAMYFVNAFPPNGSQTIDVHVLQNVLTAPQRTAWAIPVAAYNQPPDVPQLGGGVPLDSVGSRIMSGVVRNGSLWTAHAIQDPAVDAEAVVQWYQVDITGLPASGPTLAQSGNVDPGLDIHTWMSHINVDAAGNMALTFSIGGPNQFAAIGYTGRLASDPPGTTQPVRTARAGEGNYQKVAGDGRNRWGDYSGLAIDPDGCTFWLFHEYPTADNVWQTFVGAFQVDPCPMPPIANAGPDQTVIDSDNSGSELITLDGSASFDPDGTIVAYEWSMNGTVLGTTNTLTVDVAVGTWTVTLKVTDNEGSTASDTVQLTVNRPPITVFTDSFEDGDLSPWTHDIQNDWFVSNDPVIDGVFSGEVDGVASDAQLISPIIGLQGRTAATVTFSWLISSSMDKGEYLACDVSIDSGVSWTEAVRLRGNVDPEALWHAVTVEVSAPSGAVQLRFRGKMNSTDESANVDNVRVVAR